jgi:hypothetical protein
MLIKRGVVAAVMVASGVAAANPRALPMTYTTDTLPAGQVEIEQFTDLVPLAAHDLTGKLQNYLASQYQQEIEIGIADRLELGLYFVYVPARTDQYMPNDLARMPEDTGLKQRLRYILADPGEWPIDVGVYGELTESSREVEFEGKVLLQRRFGLLRVAANIVSEYETYFDHTREIVVNPSAGATYEVTPSFHAGLDSWMRAEYPQTGPAPTRTFGLGPQYYAGPAVMYNFGKLWWSVGAYLRVSDMSHDIQPGEVYGRVWIRSMIGYNL